MTAAVVLVGLVVALALLTVWVRGRLAAAERSRVRLQAFRDRLGVPVERCRVVDDGLVQGWRTRCQVPDFRHVHARRRPLPLSVRVEVDR